MLQQPQFDVCFILQFDRILIAILLGTAPHFVSVSHTLVLSNDYPNKMDVGWSNYVQSTDVCAGLEMAVSQSSVLDADVEAIQKYFVKYGTRYVLEYLPFEHWHWAGELWASLSCAQRDLKESLEFITELANAAGSLGIYGRQSPPNGIIHGFIWQTIGDRQLSWLAIMDQLCSEQTFVLQWFCGHGVGHGFVIQCDGGHQAGQPYDNVSGHAFSCAIHKCNHAPSRGLAYICSHGAYHMLMTDAPSTFNFSGDVSPRWMFPCDSWALPAFCFYYLFHDGLMASWRALALASSTSMPSFRLGDICKDARLGSDLHVRSCIYGLSSRGYFTYLWSSRSIEFSPLEACLRQAGHAFLPGTQSGRSVESESILCNLIFNDTFRSKPARSSSNLYDWCNLLLDGYYDELAWLACISGAVGFHHSFEFSNVTWCNEIASATAGLNFVNVFDHCKAALTWFSNGIEYARILNEPQDRKAETTLSSFQL